MPRGGNASRGVTDAASLAMVPSMLERRRASPRTVRALYGTALPHAPGRDRRRGRADRRPRARGPGETNACRRPAAPWSPRRADRSPGAFPRADTSRAPSASADRTSRRSGPGGNRDREAHAEPLERTAGAGSGSLPQALLLPRPARSDLIGAAARGDRRHQARSSPPHSKWLASDAFAPL